MKCMMLFYCLCVLHGSDVIGAEIDNLKKVVARLSKIPEGLNDAYCVNRFFIKRVVTTHTCEYHCPSYKAYRWNYVFSYPPKHPSQLVVVVKSLPEGTKKLDRSVLGRQLWMVDHLIQKTESKNVFKVEYKAAIDLYARSLEKKAGRNVPVVKLTADQRTLSLLPLKHIQYNQKSFQDWLVKHQLKRQEGVGEVDYARRVFLFLASYFDYKYEGTQQDRLLKTVCASKETDCAGMSAVFVALMRSQGIPSRTLAGRWAKSSQSNLFGSTHYVQQHVIAEFYAQGVGWVPVDVSSAESMIGETKRQQFFGQSPANFIIFHIDTDIRYHAKFYGSDESALLQSPAIQLLGVGTLKGAKMKETWKVEINK